MAFDEAIHVERVSWNTHTHTQTDRRCQLLSISMEWTTANARLTGIQIAACETTNSAETQTARWSCISRQLFITYIQQTHDGLLEQDFRTDAFHLVIKFPSHPDSNGNEAHFGNEAPRPTTYSSFYYRASSYASAVLGVVLLSVRLSVCHTALWQNQKCTANILIPHERVIN